MSPPRTLCLDVGGTALKAALLHDAETVPDLLRVPTTYPLDPDGLLALVESVGRSLGDHDRVSLGFPGMVRGGRVLTAPFFITTGGPGSAADPELRRAWEGFDLQGALRARLDRPVLVANDADVHGAGVIDGQGLELVITLGTGFGTGLFLDGEVSPHLELAHHPFHESETYNEQLGDAARRRVGDEAWTRRVVRSLDVLHQLLHYDAVWIGGGNARHLTPGLPPGASRASEDAGLLGGVRLWRG